MVFDSDFTTVEFIQSKKEPSNWENLCKYHTEDYCMDVMPGENTLFDIRNELNLDIEPSTQSPNHTIPISEEDRQSNNDPISVEQNQSINIVDDDSFNQSRNTSSSRSTTKESFGDNATFDFSINHSNDEATEQFLGSQLLGQDC